MSILLDWVVFCMHFISCICSYNTQDKHWLLRQATNPMTSDSIDYLDNAYRKRLETLLSVDDLVKDLMTTLEKIKQIDNTYVIFSSDNGYHLGKNITSVVIYSILDALECFASEIGSQ